MTKVRVRYAPSPTGHLHIGGARTALFNYLFAKHYNGDFIFRLEDTDIERNIEGGEASQLDNLTWLGIIPDESPLKPKPQYAPYRQMERLDIYKNYIEQLIAQDLAYHCYETSEELEQEKARQEALNLAPMYNPNLLSEEEKAYRKANNYPSVVRMRVDINKEYKFNDMIRGEIAVHGKDIGDFVILKSNGIPTYNFAVVIDDISMEITHVFRGEEHISNTPKQLVIYDALNKIPPKFAHMTLIVNENRKKLSKRDESIMQFISQYKDSGYLAPAVFNYLSLLGWSPTTEEEIFSAEELIKIFDEKRLSKSPSMFDVKKLAWTNHEYIKKLSDQEYLDFIKQFVLAEYKNNIQDQTWFDSLLLVFKQQVEYGSQINQLIAEFYSNEFNIENEALEIYHSENSEKVANLLAEKIENLSEYTAENIKKLFKEISTELSIKGKDLFMGIRTRVSGKMHGVDLSQCIYLLGKTKVLNRLKNKIKK